MSIGDLYARQGFTAEAKGHYSFVADEYTKVGNGEAAVQALERIAQVDPDDMEVKAALAELHSREGNADAAIDLYVAIAQALSEKGHPREASQLLGMALRACPASRRPELVRLQAILGEATSGSTRS